MSLWQDLRFAVRMLVKDRWFTLAAATALALGIGANATVFTLVNAVLIRGVPFDKPEQIMALRTQNQRGQQANVSFDDFEDWRDRAKSFAHLSASQNTSINVADDENVPERYQGAYVSWSFFRLIGQKPIVGRDFAESDDVTGTQPVVMLGYGIWQGRYAGDPRVLGRTIRVNGQPVVIVGVMPKGLQFPNNDDLWIPLMVLPPASFTGRAARNLAVFGRLAPNISLEQARDEMARIGADLERENPQTNKEWRPFVQAYNDSIVRGQIRTILLALMGAVVFVLLIACANVANLLLARSVTRTREIAIRASLGAGRWRIVRQLLVESVLLAFVSGAVGLVLAVGGVRWFDRATQAPEIGKPSFMTFTFDPIVFAFFAVVCLATGILFGLAPALHVSKTNVNDVLKENGRGGTGGIGARRWAGVLVVLEVVLTVVLLSGAGYMMRSFMSLSQLDVSLETTNLLAMDLFLPVSKYPQPGPRGEIFQQFSDGLAAIPTIQASALANSAPLQAAPSSRFGLDGQTPPEGQPQSERMVSVVAVGDNYFQTLGLGLIRGRSFQRDDGLAGKGAAVVNERFTALHSRGTDPIGRQIRLMDGPNREGMRIVGVVPNVRQNNPRDPDPDPVVYVPLRSNPQRTPTLFVRTSSSAAVVMPQIREALRIIDPDLPLFRVQTMEGRLAQSRWQYVVFGTMATVLAGVALLLSALGLFSVTTYSVTQRRQEIGVRMALGAQPGGILWLVLRRALIQLAIGLPLGLAGAATVGRLLQSVLVQTGPKDVATLATVGMILIVVTIAACLWPARRAAALNPVIALRGD